MINSRAIIALVGNARPMSACAGGLLVVVAALAATVGAGAAQNPGLPRLETNQAYVEEVTRTTTLSISGPIATFSFLLNSRPDLPTVVTPILPRIQFEAETLPIHPCRDGAGHRRIRPEPSHRSDYYRQPHRFRLLPGPPARP